MDGINLLRLQKKLGLFSALALIIFFASLVDGLVGQMLQGFNSHDLYPGKSLLLSGPMPVEAENAEDVRILRGEREEQEGPDMPGRHLQAQSATDSSPAPRLMVDKVYKGYWMGGRMWRGHLDAPQGAPAGRYVFAAKDEHGGKQNPALVFTFRIWADEADWRAHAGSRIVRWLGWNPFVVTACLSPLPLLCGLLTWRTGRLAAASLKRNMSAEIFRVKTLDDGRVLAGMELGAAQGVEKGQIFVIRSLDGRLYGEARVESVLADEAGLILDSGSTVHPGLLAALKNT